MSVTDCRKSKTVNTFQYQCYSMPFTLSSVLLLLFLYLLDSSSSKHSSFALNQGSEDWFEVSLHISVLVQARQGSLFLLLSPAVLKVRLHATAIKAH